MQIMMTTKFPILEATNLDPYKTITTPITLTISFSTKSIELTTNNLMFRRAPPSHPSQTKSNKPQ